MVDSDSSCSNTNMDNFDDHIWRRRIHHGVRYQKSSLPFPDSIEIGVDFNAALEREDKLDMCLLTNGVLLELWDFAKTVTKSEKYFIFEILEHNFDLGVDVNDEPLCYGYAARIHSKIKMMREQFKCRVNQWKKAFTLPDINSIMAEQTERYYPKINKLVDISVLSGGSKSRLPKRSTTSFFVKTRGGVQQLTADAFPFCRDLGVTLMYRPGDAPKVKLNTNLITNGVMIELLHFAKVFCGTHVGIVLDLVEQNFGQKLDKLQLRTQVNKLIERKYTCQTAEDKEAFRKEVFKMHEPKPRKRKCPDVDDQGVEQPTDCKRQETPTLQDADEKDLSQDSDLSYMCPVDFEAVSETGADKNEVESLSETNCHLDVQQQEEEQEQEQEEEEEEEVIVSSGQPQIYPLNTDLKDLSYLFHEDKNKEVEVKTYNQKLWKRRSTRSKQILKSSKVNDMFARCRERGLDFNVTSGNNWNMDLLLLTNAVLWEIVKFANAMTKSLRTFFFEIINFNFVYIRRDELHERNFLFYSITKEKTFQTHPDREKLEFLNSPFNLPETYVVTANDGDVGVDAVQQPEWNESQQADMDLHPFCKNLGINLWSEEERPPSQKLSLSALTNGAVLEIFDFIRELCGSVREMVNDILEHNFDLQLQSGATEASLVIQRWYSIQKTIMKRQTPSPKIIRWLSLPVPLNGRMQVDPDSPTASVLMDDLEADMAPLNGDENEEEQEEISYPTCEGIGLDLDINVEREAKTKLELKVLTRGVLLEMHQYVMQNCNRYVPGLYEILEYNFDLSSQSHRKVEFAWSFASNVISIARKTGRKGEYLNRVVELPMQVPESSQVVCKDEPEDRELDPDDGSDVVFVQKLKPVDIEVEIE